jgi:hypothetical protein
MDCHRSEAISKIRAGDRSAVHFRRFDGDRSDDLDSSKSARWAVEPSFSTVSAAAI